MVDQYGAQVNDFENGLEVDAKPFTPEEAALLRPTIVGLSPWVVVGVQAVAGLLVVLIVWLVSAQAAWMVSTAYGVFSVLLPAVFLARGLTRKRQVLTPAQALAGVFFWEFVKVALTLVLLIVAPWVVMGLNWLALLAGFVVTMKASWIAMLWWHRRKALLTVY
jgi:ATP synthase protein I